jgi:Cu2+-exporting ATPase
VFYPPLGPLSVPPQVYVHRRLYVHGVRRLVRERTVTVDLLVTGLSVAALLHGYFFIYSLGGLLLLCTKNLLDKVKQDSRADYADVFRQQARTVWVRVDGVEIETPLDAVEVGDVVAIAAGQTVPVDGSIVEGAATVDQHVMTGEAIPAEKGVGERVLALTVVLSGKIFVRVEKTGPATAAAHIARVLERTVDFKTGRQLRVERVAGRLLVPALLAGLFTWPVFGASAGLAVVDSHPRYKTTLASSIGLLNYFKLAARQGLLIKDGRTLEALNDVDTVVFDKTGTLTLARPHLAGLHACSSHTQAEVLAFAAAAEQHQPHPIAAAILDAARARGVSIPATTEADYRVGYGLTVTIDRATVRVGSMRFMEMEALAVPPAMRDVQARCHDEGHALVLVAVDGAVAGALELHTTVRPEARRIVDGLRRRGITSMYVISGDHEAPTRRLAEALGIERYFAETLPEKKALLIERLVGEGKVVCYVGDGINDSIAMKTSHVSVSLRGASTVATDTAEVILLDASLNQLCALFDLARDCNRNMRLIVAAVIAPGLVCLGGVLFGGFTFLESRILNYVSVGTGVGAAMLPSLTSTVPRRPRSPRRLRIPRRRRARGT